MAGSEERIKGSMVELELEERTPESWEMADLEENMKKLLAATQVSSSSSSSASMVSAVDCRGVGGEVVGVLDSVVGGHRGVEQVDSFLREALQNPRDRLTRDSEIITKALNALVWQFEHEFSTYSFKLGVCIVLRLEQEVERFMHNPGQQMLEFQPMPSSYLRLAAHRVAQHYSLQSMVVDSGSTEGTRIVARKTSGSRYPAVRLVDIPVTMNQEDKTDVPSVMPVKIAIKQRPQKGSHAYGGGLGGNDSKINTSKSVEERKEEYNKARARIFCSKLGGKGDDDESEPESEASVDCFRSDAGRLEKAKDEDAVSASLMNQHSESPPMAIRTVITSAEKEKEHVRGKPSTSNGMGNGMSNGGSRVAIFRDREKDRRDPDYDRNTSRYGQRFDPGFGVSLGPYGVQALYAPLVNYNTEFPQLGVASRPQAHMEPPRPPPIPQQHMQASWTPPVNTMSYRPPDPSLMRPFSPAHTAPVAMYMHPPQYAYAGHAMTYMHPPDSYQQSLSQPHPQQQPDTSFNQTWRH